MVSLRASATDAVGCKRGHQVVRLLAALGARTLREHEPVVRLGVSIRPASLTNQVAGAVAQLGLVEASHMVI